MSFDMPTYPRIELQFPHKNTKYKISCGWYKNDGRNGLISTDMVNQDNYSTILNDASLHERYQWGGMLYSLQKKILTYSYNNCDWFININVQDAKKPVNDTIFNLDTGKTSTLKDNKSIYASWLFRQFSIKEININNKINWQTVYELFSMIDADNPCTIILTCGSEMIFYQGSNFSNSLYYLRSLPPHQNHGLFSTGDLEFQMNAKDLNHTLMLISSTPIAHKDSKFLNLNQMIVVKSGEVIWNNDPHSLWKKNISEATLADIPFPSELNKISLLKIPFKSSENNQSNKHIVLPTESLDDKPHIYSILHRTCFEYDAPVYSSKHLFRLQPVSDLVQTVINYDVSVFANGRPIHCIPTNFTGAFGNKGTFIEINERYTHLEIISQSVVVVLDYPPRRFDLLHIPSTIPLIWMPWDRIMMQAYLVPPELPESELRELSEYALSFVKRNNNDVFSVLDDINRTINKDYTYVPGSSTLSTTPYQVYVNHRGVCQDFANLFICLARLLNIPARYRMGYIYTGKNYEHSEQGDSSHAWVEVYLPYIGWQGYDPTNCCLAGKNHVRVACGRTYSDTAPTSGTIFSGGGKEILSTDVRVVPIDTLDERHLK